MVSILSTRLVGVLERKVILLRRDFSQQAGQHGGNRGVADRERQRLQALGAADHQIIPLQTYGGHAHPLAYASARYTLLEYLDSGDVGLVVAAKAHWLGRNADYLRRLDELAAQHRALISFGP